MFYIKSSFVLFFIAFYIELSVFEGEFTWSNKSSKEIAFLSKEIHRWRRINGQCLLLRLLLLFVTLSETQYNSKLSRYRNLQWKLEMEIQKFKHLLTRAQFSYSLAVHVYNFKLLRPVALHHDFNDFLTKRAFDQLRRVINMPLTMLPCCSSQDCATMLNVPRRRWMRQVLISESWNKPHPWAEKAFEHVDATTYRLITLFQISLRVQVLVIKMKSTKSDRW